MNALLTQMDRLKSWPNVIILTTSNITTAIGKLFMPLNFMMLLAKGLELDVVILIIFFLIFSLRYKYNKYEKNINRDVLLDLQF